MVRIEPRRFFMNTEIDINIQELLDRPIWQMTGREYCALTQYANGLRDGQDARAEGRRALVNGVQALADGLGCSPSTIYSLMRTVREEDGSAADGGILKEAIVSRIGRRIVFDVERARTLANNYKKNNE